MPYLKFPGDWLEHHTRIMEPNYWGGTECRGAGFDDGTQEWVVRVVRDGSPVTLRPKQLVFALGVSGYPNIPAFDGAGCFLGEQRHSSQHPGDGDHVTMVQRSSTHIARSESLMDLALGDLYSEKALANGVTTEKADLLFASLPMRILPEAQVPVYQAMAERDADFYSQLEAAGFDLDFGVDGSGLFVKYLRRGSGYYIDVGASQLIIDGRVQLRSGEVSKITGNAVVLGDGTELEADLIMYATGYGSDTPKDPGPWEGELRNMWKPTNVPNLWIHGGNLHQSRHYSSYLALQLKARMEGLETPVYELQPRTTRAEPVVEPVEIVETSKRLRPAQPRPRLPLQRPLTFCRS